MHYIIPLCYPPVHKLLIKAISEWCNIFWERLPLVLRARTDHDGGGWQCLIIITKLIFCFRKIITVVMRYNNIVVNIM